MGVIYVNKPKGITSFDVCFKLRKILKTSKIGHTGTLDPNATGVMIILFDEATKANQFLVSDTKEYVGKCLLGIKTDTLDIDGKILKEETLKTPLKAELEAVFSSFLGKYEQLPPMTAAIKIGGKKLYEYQREGIEVEVKKREVEIFELELLDISDSEFTFKTKVSSGTYIRSLLNDILDKLNLIGTLKELERTKINDISIDMCNTLKDIENNNYKIHNLYEILSKRYKVVKYNDSKIIKDGKRIKLDSNEDEVLIVDNDNKVLAIYGKDKDEYKSIRGLF